MRHRSLCGRVHERIGRDVSSPEDISRRRLRGRDPEIGMLSRRLDELVLGRGGVVLIRGAAGLGKSALLTEAEAMASERGARVFHGGSHVADRSLPLGPLLDALVTADDPPVDAAVLRDSAEMPTNATGCCVSCRSSWSEQRCRTPS
jgi:hypothetical protein